jgi:hypothetical protein
MASTQIFRGTAVLFSTSFVDANSAAVIPASAQFFLTYPSPAGPKVEVELPLANNAGTFSTQWDSAVSAPGVIEWSVRSDNPAIAQDGSFSLAANAANPPPA